MPADLPSALFWFVLTVAVVGTAAWLAGAFETRNRQWPAWSMKAAEVIATTFGVGGALLLAIPGVHPALGFASFLASNLAGIPFNRHQGHRWFLARERCYLVFSLFGLWNWWLGPLLLG